MSDFNLIKNLQRAEIYPHPVKGFRLLETHSSWVILTGEYVYKIKKPVDFGFLNYSTLDQRKFYCGEEIRLNQLFSPELYVGVVPITGTIENPQINGTGPVIEYAVKMQEFSQDSLFLELLKNRKVTEHHMDQLAELIANFHQATDVAAADNIFGTPEHVHAPVVQNFDQILPLLKDDEDKAQLERLRVWSDRQYNLHYDLLQQRKNNGFIRDCHGDLHLGNIILFAGRPVLFDRIEFNDDFRWTDVIADVAFLAMDLDYQGAFILGKRFLNHYFNLTGDYAGLAVLPYYQAYRAIVRAKVTLFNLLQSGLTEDQQHKIREQYRKFMDLAEHYTKQHTPSLIITCGLAGSGKSTVSRMLVERIAAYQVRSDIERKRLFNLPVTAQLNSDVNAGIYDPAVTQRVYNRLADCAQTIIRAGYTAIVDAAFLLRTPRDFFHNLANDLRVPFLIVFCKIPHEELEARIIKRREEQKDPSEARLDILAMQHQVIEPLDEKEQANALFLETQDLNGEMLLNQLAGKLMKK